MMRESSRWLSSSALHCALVCALSLSSTAMPSAAMALDGVDTVRVAEGLNRPIFVTAPPGDYERLFIMEQRGVVRILNLLTGELYDEPFLDIDAEVVGPTSSFSEQGLLGMAFHPDYLENGYFFVQYTGTGPTTRVARYSVDPDDPNRALDDALDEVLLLEFDQPYSNHNGGTIAFGPLDGYLYLMFGDGGSGNDPGDNAQDMGVYLGKILRIDVDDFDSGTYAIPSDNPFADTTGVLPEIWASGLRNPYRWSFDRETGDIYIADVGQGAEEELDFQSAASAGGENYGWCCYEGDNCVTTNDHCSCSCDDDTLIFPIQVYGHSSGRCSITGGYVYRGGAIDDLAGTYFYSDWCSDETWTLAYDGDAITAEEEVTDDLAPGSGLGLSDIAGFGEDAWGELYIVDRGTTTTGEIYKLVPDTIADFDCNENSILDSAELDAGVAADCDLNGILDSCQIADGTSLDANGNGTPDECENRDHVRGDSNSDGSIDIADPIHELLYLFESGAALCRDAMDVNDDGALDVSDAVYSLSFLFADGAAPPAPYPACGPDESDDASGNLGCGVYSECN